MISLTVVFDDRFDDAGFKAFLEFIVRIYVSHGIGYHVSGFRQTQFVYSNPGDVFAGSYDLDKQSLLS